MVYVESILKNLTVEKNTAQLYESLHQKCPWVQILDCGYFNLSDRPYWYVSQGTCVFENNVATYVPNSSYVSGAYVDTSWKFTFYAHHKYLIICDLKADPGKTLRARICLVGATVDNQNCNVTDTWNTFYAIGERGSDTDTIDGWARFQLYDGSLNTLHARRYMIFDLTDMFGEGKEPASYADFIKYYPAPYYRPNHRADYRKPRPGE